MVPAERANAPFPVTRAPGCPLSAAANWNYCLTIARAEFAGSSASGRRRRYSAARSLRACNRDRPEAFPYGAMSFSGKRFWLLLVHAVGSVRQVRIERKRPKNSPYQPQCPRFAAGSAAVEGNRGNLDAPAFVPMHRRCSAAPVFVPLLRRILRRSVTAILCTALSGQRPAGVSSAPPRGTSELRAVPARYAAPCRDPRCAGMSHVSAAMPTAAKNAP
jgi:hypothetical protein